MLGLPKISVIIPVYRVEAYIENCIHSLNEQTLEDLELIFIDDCGGDASMDIVARYAESDPRIRILKNQHNLGAGMSRNGGIEAARGEYIAFLDPDDWIDERFFEVLYGRAKSEHADIAKARRVKATVHDDGAIVYSDSKVNDKIKTSLMKGMPLYSCFTAEHQSAIFSREMVQGNGVRNGSTSHSENSVFLMAACRFCEGFTIDGDVAYYYFQRADSSVHTKDEKRYTDEIVSFSEQLSFAAAHVEYDDSFVFWLHNKVNFLLRRYEGIVGDETLRARASDFLHALHDELMALPEEVQSRLIEETDEMASCMVKGDWAGFKTARKLAKQAAENDKASNSAKAEAAKKNDSKAKPRTAASLVVPPSGFICLDDGKTAMIAAASALDDELLMSSRPVSGVVGDWRVQQRDISAHSELLSAFEGFSSSGELCWLYEKRCGKMMKTVYYRDDEGDLAVRGEVIGPDEAIDAGPFTLHPVAQVKVPRGLTLRQYVAKRGRGAVISELVRYLRFLFDLFDDGAGTLRGEAYSAVPDNCIVTDEHAYELVNLNLALKNSIDRGFMIYQTARVLGPSRRKAVYFELCEHFHTVPMWRHWDDFDFRNRYRLMLVDQEQGSIGTDGAGDVLELLSRT